MEILAVSDIHSARPLGHPPFGILSHHVQILDVGKVYRCMEQIDALREAQKLKPFHVLDLLQKNIERGSVVLIFGKYSVLTYIVYGDKILFVRNGIQHFVFKPIPIYAHGICIG